MKKAFTILALMSLIFLGSYTIIQAHTLLNSGDNVILEFYCNGTDEFTFIPLAYLSTGTTINIADNEWYGSAFFKTEDVTCNLPCIQENIKSYTTLSAISKGTLIKQNTATFRTIALVVTTTWPYHTDKWGKGGYTNNNLSY